ncbi:MAG: HPr family phosphocarrier protein [Lachnospiraceae bacterium]|nr:HPr family phosphocarrier protein [Lachnospiraceae bacterium]
MVRWEYTIRDRQGLHARPIAQIAAALMKRQCRAVISGRRGDADAKDMMAMMGLGAGVGEVLTFSFEGRDEDAASEELQNLLVRLGL